MERWQDQGIVIAVRPHSEVGAIVSCLTQTKGRHLGYVQGGRSSKKRPILDLGNHIELSWQARIEDNMGSFSVELIKNFSSDLLSDYNPLMAMQSACALMDMALPEREAHPALYEGTLALFESLASEYWAESYIFWEMAFLKEMGFGLDLKSCAGGGNPDDLGYVSPKTARAVSFEKGTPYKDKLLPLPQFLIGKEDEDHTQALSDGLALCAYFLEHRLFADTNYQGFPEIRQRLADTITG